MQARNELIDGWRGISVLLVIIGHLMFFRLDIFSQMLPLHTILSDRSSGVLFVCTNVGLLLLEYITTPFAILGVDVFFLISGFLITSLLLQEEERYGSISVFAFYVRRIFRIMPAFYAMIFVTFLLWRNDLIMLPGSAFPMSAFYLCNISEGKCSWWLAHTWSLAVEEQFYLIWPAMFLLGRTIRQRTIVGFVIGLPIASLFFPIFISFDFIAIGALIASVKTLRLRIEGISTKQMTLILLIILLLLPFFEYANSPLIRVAISILQPIFVTLLVFGTLSRKGPLLPIVSMRAIQKVGVISYSLYLWQQMSLAPKSWLQMDTGAELYLHRSVLTIFLFVVPAVLSYFLIEQPFIEIGRRWSRKIIETNQTVSGNGSIRRLQERRDVN